MKIKNYIINKAKELDIDMMGFTNSEPLFNLEEYLKYRIANNIITEFEETDINKRIDPKLTMANCKTIIVIALSYNIDFKEKSSCRLKGSLSKSSWGQDYHKVLQSKMINLISEIKKIQDFEYKYFVDTGPLVDRELAKKSGLGYYGKNCNIINDDYGSFIFIGYILTDLEFNIDSNSIDSECGECDLCIRACPTNALEEAYKLNPKKCISYLTQTKKPLDIYLKEKMGIKIYGCDTCQLVCPKNKDVKKSTHEEFIPILTSGVIDIEELLVMTNREFKVKYGSMAGSWRGKNILKRNSINALENIKNEKNQQLIQRILENT